MPLPMKRTRELVAFRTVPFRWQRRGGECGSRAVLPDRDALRAGPTRLGRPGWGPALGISTQGPRAGSGRAEGSAGTEVATDKV